MPILTPFVLILDAIAYRFRGGGWIQSGNTICRVVWSLMMVISYLMLVGANVNWPYIPLLFIGSYLSLLVPHAYCQNMGRWGTSWEEMPPIKLFALLGKTYYALKYWPAYVVSKIIPDTSRTLRDVVGMCVSGMLRGAIVFAPYALLTHQYWLLLIGGVAKGILQSLAYVTGWYVPWTFPSLVAHSTEWCELFDGVAWGISMLIVVTYGVS